MGRTYYLDLQTLLDYLCQGGQSCFLKATLANRTIGYIVVRAGTVVSCSVYDANGVIMEGKQAQKMLADCTEWFVEMEDELPPPPPSPFPPYPPTPLSPSMPPDQQRSGERTYQPGQYTPPMMPRYPPTGSSPPGPSSPHRPIFRRQDLTDQQMASLTTKQRMQLRMVMTLINGSRSAEEIKAQLNLAPETVEGILAYLRALNIIN